jgi:hypothetical protein
MDAKARAIFRQAMREIGRKGGKIWGQALAGDHDAGGADRTGEEGSRWPRRRSGRPRGWRENGPQRSAPIDDRIPVVCGAVAPPRSGQQIGRDEAECPSRLSVSVGLTEHARWMEELPL